MEAANQRSSKDRVRAARAEASAWIVQLHGPHRSPTVEAGFRAWLAESPENARQFERVTEVWDAGSTPVPGVTRVGHWQQQSQTHRWSMAAVAAFVVMGLGFWALNFFWLNPAYSTGVGEQRILRLSDGTRITLNSDSRISVAYRELQRRVRVDRGEAYFEVAKDVARPFMVRAGMHRVQALGTAFIVRYEGERTAVTLVEGKVAVLSSPPPQAGEGRVGASAITLSPGQRLTFVGTSRPKLDEPRLEAVTAWRRGEVMLDKTALADAVVEMNRYGQTPLVIDDPRIAGLKVSGIYHTGDSETFATMIARLYGLEVVHRSGRISLTNPKAPASN